MAPIAKPTKTPEQTAAEKAKAKPGTPAKPETKVAPIDRGSVPKNYNPDTFATSPLKVQQIFSKGGEELPAAIKLVPLSGRYRGVAWEIGGTLGIAVNEVTQSYGAEWKPNQAGTFAPGVSFVRLTEEKFSVTLSFYDATYDISHLTEGIKHLREISGVQRSPPILQYRQGDMKCNVVLLDVSTKFSEPHAGKLRGFAHADAVTLNFLQVAGPGSANAQLGAPLTGTAQNDKASKQTEKERLVEGRKALVDDAVGACLGEAAQKQLNQAIDKDKLEDIGTLNSLDPTAFVTLAIAKKISPAQLAAEPLASKLKRDLASFIAKGEDGVGKDHGGDPGTGIKQDGLGVDVALIRYYTASDAAAPGILSGLSTGIQPQASKGRESYKAILAAVQIGNLDNDSTVSTIAGDTLKRSGFQCAARLAQVDIAALRGRTDASDPTTINNMQAFASKHRAKNGDDLKAYKEAFGLEDDGQARQLASILPQPSRAAFEAAANAKFGKNPKLSGLVLFSKFAAYVPPAPGPLPGP